MTLIRQLFARDRDPTRHLNEIVNAEEKLDVKSEIDEYVFTDHTREYLRTLIDGILDTGQGRIPEVACGWIAGFFGSGKSHFLKLAGALLENREIEREGVHVPALQYLAEQRRLDVPWERLARDFRIKAVTVNLALALGGTAQAQRSPLLYRLASEINRAWRFSAVPHIAAIEREIQKTPKKWQTFLDLVLERNEREGDVDDEGVPFPWASPQIRDLAAEAHRILEDVLPQVSKYSKPREYLKELEAEKPSPEKVVQLAVEFAKSLHPDFGRVLLCVDEVALYLKGSVASGFDAERVREVQGLAESVKDKGGGRVFLFATAQLRVDTIDGSFGKDIGNHVLFLRDRFPRGGRLELEERDIDTVVRERWLKKDETSPHWSVLREKIAVQGGTVANVAKLRDVSILREGPSLTDDDQLLAYYPCLPYHVQLLQEILSSLRRDEQVGQTAAQSRALLTAVRALFLPQNGGRMADEPLGKLVTFDRVYDVIRDAVRIAENDTDRWICEVIDALPPHGSIPVGAAARVIFLLQQLNPREGRPKIRVSVENVAALLYPSIDAPWEPHLRDVRAAIDDLEQKNFIDEEREAGFRFYRAEEKTFRETLKGFIPDDVAINQFLCGAAEKEAKRLGMRSFPRPSGHALDVAVSAHTLSVTIPDPTRKGLELHLVWLPSGKGDGPVRQWAARFAEDPERVIWVLRDGDSEEIVRELLQLELAIADYDRKHGVRALELLKRERGKLDELREVRLPAAIERAIELSTVVHCGTSTVLAGGGKKPIDVFRERMRHAVELVFPEIEKGDVPVDDPVKVLTWKTSQPLPEAFRKLQLFDASSGQVLVDRTFLKEIQHSMRGRKDEDRTGKAVLERLRSTNGWPEGAIKAGLGALLVARRIIVRVPGEPPIVTTDGTAQSWLGGVHKFNRAVIELIETGLTPGEIAVLADIFAVAFDEPGVDTLEKLERSVGDVLTRISALVGEATAALETTRLPGCERLQRLDELLAAAKGAAYPIGKLRNLLDGALTLGDPLSALTELARLARTVRTLSKAGKLRRLEQLRDRFPLYRSLDERSADLAALEASIESPTLLLEADRALERDARCFDDYARAFRARHDEVRNESDSALGLLERHPTWGDLTPERKREIRSQVGSCTAAGDLTIQGSPDGHCPDCRLDYTGLVTKRQLIALRAQEAARELDEPRGIGEAPPSQRRRSSSHPPPREILIDIRTEADVTSAVAQVELEIRQAVPPVRLRFTLEDPKR